jgi:hypothetical protein
MPGDVQGDYPPLHHRFGLQNMEGLARDDDYDVMSGEHEHSACCVCIPGAPGYDDSETHSPFEQMPRLPEWHVEAPHFGDAHWHMPWDSNDENATDTNTTIAPPHGWLDDLEDFEEAIVPDLMNLFGFGGPSEDHDHGEHDEHDEHEHDEHDEHEHDEHDEHEHDEHDEHDEDHDEEGGGDGHEGEEHADQEKHEEPPVNGTKGEGAPEGSSGAPEQAQGNHDYANEDAPLDPVDGVPVVSAIPIEDAKPVGVSPGFEGMEGGNGAPLQGGEGKSPAKRRLLSASAISKPVARKFVSARVQRPLQRETLAQIKKEINKGGKDKFILVSVPVTARAGDMLKAKGPGGGEFAFMVPKSVPRDRVIKVDIPAGAVPVKSAVLNKAHKALTHALADGSGAAAGSGAGAAEGSGHGAPAGSTGSGHGAPAGSSGHNNTDVDGAGMGAGSHHGSGMGAGSHHGAGMGAGSHHGSGMGAGSHHGAGMGAGSHHGSGMGAGSHHGSAGHYPEYDSNAITSEGVHIGYGPGKSPPRAAEDEPCCMCPLFDPETGNILTWTHDPAAHPTRDAESYKTFMKMVDERHHQLEEELGVRIFPASFVDFSHHEEHHDDDGEHHDDEEEHEDEHGEHDEEEGHEEMPEGVNATETGHGAPEGSAGHNETETGDGAPEGSAGHGAPEGSAGHGAPEGSAGAGAAAGSSGAAPAAAKAIRTQHLKMQGAKKVANGKVARAKIVKSSVSKSKGLKAPAKVLAQAAAKPVAAKPIAVEAVAKLVKPMAQAPVAQAVAEPVAQAPVAQAVAEPLSKPMAQAPVAQAVAEPLSKPMAQAPVAQAVAEPLSKPMAQAPVAQAVAEPLSKPMAQAPVAQAVAEPLSKPMAQAPVAQAVAQPLKAVAEPKFPGEKAMPAMKPIPMVKA